MKFVHFQKLRDVRNCVTQPILIEMLCDCCLPPMGIDVLPNGFSKKFHSNRDKILLTRSLTVVDKIPRKDTQVFTLNVKVKRNAK